METWYLWQTHVLKAVEIWFRKHLYINLKYSKQVFSPDLLMCSWDFSTKLVNTKDLRKYNKRKKVITKTFTRCEDLILEFSNDDKSSRNYTLPGSTAIYLRGNIDDYAILLLTTGPRFCSYVSLIETSQRISSQQVKLNLSLNVSPCRNPANGKIESLFCEL